jgi:hypothetical protein
MKMMRIFFTSLFLAVSMIIEAQQVIVGRITDASGGQPLTGANIFIANTTIGTTSDLSGYYRITVSGTGSFEIVVSYMGYQSFIHKVDVPQPFHQIDVALDLKITELSEVTITAPKTYSQKDVDLFWIILLGEKQSKKGLEALNPEKVHFYLNSDQVLKVSCDEPIEIVNHEMGYHIQYVLQSFQYDYMVKETLFFGMPFFKELIPESDSQKRRWENKRKEVSEVSITRFIHALYRDKIHEEGFLLVKSESENFLNTDDLKVVSSNSIKKTVQDQVYVNIDSTILLGCFSKPVTRSTIWNRVALFRDNRSVFPMLSLMPQQFTIYSDGTYSGILRINEIRGRLTGLSSILPNEYYE